MGGRCRVPFDVKVTSHSDDLDLDDGQVCRNLLLVQEKERFHEFLCRVEVACLRQGNLRRRLQPAGDSDVTIQQTYAHEHVG